MKMKVTFDYDSGDNTEPSKILDNFLLSMEEQFARRVSNIACTIPKKELDVTKHYFTINVNSLKVIEEVLTIVWHVLVRREAPYKGTIARMRLICDINTQINSIKRYNNQEINDYIPENSEW